MKNTNIILSDDNKFLKSSGVLPSYLNCNDSSQGYFERVTTNSLETSIVTAIFPVKIELKYADKQTEE